MNQTDWIELYNQFLYLCNENDLQLHSFRYGGPSRGWSIYYTNGAGTLYHASIVEAIKSEIGFLTNTQKLKQIAEIKAQVADLLDAIQKLEKEINK